jgi:hypothetical protein
MTQSQQDSVEQILDEFLGEYHQHKCPAHLGENCINCRGTGYNQTPCLMCDKGGISFKRKKEAVAKLQQLMVEAKLEQARNDISNSTAGISNDIDYLKAQLTHPATEEEEQA